MEHTAHGYWLEEAGAVDAGAAARRRARRRRGRRRRRLHRALGGLAREASWSPRRASSCSRPDGLRARAERSQRRLLQRDVVLAGEHAAALGRRAGAGRRPRRRGRRSTGSATSASEEGVDAWFRRGGYLQVSTAPAHDATVAGGARRLPRARRRPSAVRPLSRGRGRGPLRLAALPRRRLLPERGDRAAGAARARPARAAAARAGVELFESSPVRSLRDGADGVEARDRGRDACARRGAVLAIGGAAKSRRGPLRSRLTIASSHIVLTEPVPELLEEVGWTGGECITDSRALVDYFRTTPDGRIAFGWGGGRIAMGARLGGRSELDAERRRRGRRAPPRLLPAASPGTRITHAWGGPIDASPTHLPLVLPLRRRPRLRRRRLHRQRRRPLAHGRPHPRLARPRPPRRALPPRLRRPLPAAGPARALPVDRRRSDPGRASSPRRRPSSPAASPAGSLDARRASPS